MIIFQICTLSTSGENGGLKNTKWPPIKQFSKLRHILKQSMQNYRFGPLENENMHHLYVLSLNSGKKSISILKFKMAAKTGSG